MEITCHLYFQLYNPCFKLKEIKGSVSTLVRAKIGPNDGGKLKLEDKIFVKKSNLPDNTKKIQLDLNIDNSIRVMKGLQFHYFSKKSQEDFFSKEKNTKIIQSLMSVLSIEDFNKINKKGKLSNKNIMFTGGFEKMSRSEAKTLVENNGGKVLGTISKKLDILWMTLIIQ